MNIRYYILEMASGFPEMSHEDQIEEVKRHRKPMALVLTKLGRDSGLPRITVDGEYSIYYQPSHRSGAQELSALLDIRHSNSSKHTDDYHRRVGELLGYDEDDIESFLKRRSDFPWD